MKKGLPFLFTGIVIAAVAIFGFANAERIAGAGRFLIESTTKTVGLAIPKDNKPSAIERWAGGMVGCVQNLEVEVDYAGLYTRMGTAVVERLTKNMVEEKLEDFGITVDKADDGSTTYADNNGNEIKQNADGSWNINIGGTSIELSDSNWPDNEFTKQVPKPEVEPTATATEENSFSVAFLGIGVAELRQYVEELKTAGFTENVSGDDYEMLGLVVYRYAASNDAGYRVEVSYAMDMCGMTITKE